MSVPKRDEPQPPRVPVEIVQQVIDHPGLQKFLHPGVAGRVPLIISGALLEEPLGLKKWGQPVRFLGPGELQGRPHLEFTGFHALAGLAVVRYEYRTEGVEGLIVFEKSQSDRWTPLAHRIVEN